MKKKQIIALTLGLLLTSAIVADPSIARASTKDEIKGKIESNKEKIDELEEKKDGMQGDKSESSKKLEEAKANFNKQNELLTQTRQKVLSFEKEINTLQVQIDEFASKIKVVEEEIVSVKKEIEEIEKELEKKEEILGKRLRSTYMNNIGDRMLYMIIDSKNIGDLISNVTNINIIIKTDQELMADIEKDKALIEKEKANLVNKETELTNSKNAVVESQEKVKESKEEVAKLEAEYATEAAKLKALEDARSREYDVLTAEEKAIQSEISKYEHDNVNLQEYFNNLSQGPVNPPSSGGGSNNSNSGSGGESSNDAGSSNGGGAPSVSTGFIRPVGGPITSRYGTRTHPITGKPGSFHGGVDFGSPTGTPVKAIASGVVTSAGWHNAFGNMVIIDHGNGYSSLYAHNSSLNVSVGQSVNQGQVVSAVGSTGNSTGPHLHLEMRYNGSHVNPEHYIG